MKNYLTESVKSYLSEENLKKTKIKLTKGSSFYDEDNFSETSHDFASKKIKASYDFSSKKIIPPIALSNKDRLFLLKIETNLLKILKNTKIPLKSNNFKPKSKLKPSKSFEIPPSKQFNDKDPPKATSILTNDTQKRQYSVNKTLTNKEFHNERSTIRNSMINSKVLSVSTENFIKTSTNLKFLIILYLSNLI